MSPAPCAVHADMCDADFHPAFGPSPGGEGACLPGAWLRSGVRAALDRGLRVFNEEELCAVAPGTRLVPQEELRQGRYPSDGSCRRDGSEDVEVLPPGHVYVRPMLHHVVAW